METKIPHPSRRLSQTDAAFLYLERKEIPLNIATVSLFDGPIPFDEFVANLESKLHLIPRYRQVPVSPPFSIGYPSWEDDPYFDIRQHIFHVRLDSPGTDAELEAFAGKILGQVMDRRKPLWDVHIIDGLADGRGALIARLHHSLADGVSGEALMKVMFDATRDGWKERRKAQAAETPGRKAAERTVSDAIARAVYTSLQSMITAEAALLDFVQGLFSERMQHGLQGLLGLMPEVAAVDRLPFNKPCGGERKFCWTEIDFETAHGIAHAAHATLNDVILAIVTRAISRYSRMHGQDNRFVRIVCPVNIRRGDNGEAMGNQITFLPVSLPLDMEEPKRLLAAVAARTEIMKSARAAHLVAILAGWIGVAPAPLQAAFWWGLPMVQFPRPLLNTICTNIPGSPVPLYSIGRRMIASYPHVPTGYELGVNFAVQSYAGKLYFGLTADAQVASDVGKLRDFMPEAFEELCRAFGMEPGKKQPEPKPAARKARAAKAAAPERKRKTAARKPEPAVEQSAAEPIAVGAGTVQ